MKNSTAVCIVRSSVCRAAARLTAGAIAFLCLIGASVDTAGQEATFAVRLLTPETALKLARATLEACRKEGFQVAVAVTDRFGVTQVILRDRFAGPHTVGVAVDKAWTAVSFRQDTLSFAAATADPRHSGPRHFDRVVAVGGGVLVEAGGSILGGLGVSGAPGGDADDRCAKAGLEAIRDDINFLIFLFGRPVYSAPMNLVGFVLYRLSGDRCSQAAKRL